MKSFHMTSVRKNLDNARGLWIMAFQGHCFSDFFCSFDNRTPFTFSGFLDGRSVVMKNPKQIDEVMAEYFAVAGLKTRR